MAKREPKKRRSWRFRKRQLQNVAILPTLITLGNLVCGVIAIFLIAKGYSQKFDQGSMASAQYGYYTLAGWLIFLGMFFDAVDGRVARMTKTASEFGAQLDSLCDLVTFGVAPAFLVYALSLSGTDHPAYMERGITILSVFYVVCATVRLARFNIETTTRLDSHMDFDGLPSPASAGVIAASVIPWNHVPEWEFFSTFQQDILPITLPFVLIGLAVLMVSRIGYPHILNKLFRSPRPFFVLVQVILIVVLIVLFYEFAVFLAFTGYALSGPIVWLRHRLRKKPVNDPEKAGAPAQEKPFF